MSMKITSPTLWLMLVAALLLSACKPKAIIHAPYQDQVFQSFQDVRFGITFEAPVNQDALEVLLNGVEISEEFTLQQDGANLTLAGDLKSEYLVSGRNILLLRKPAIQRIEFFYDDIGPSISITHSEFVTPRNAEARTIGGIGITPPNIGGVRVMGIVKDHSDLHQVKYEAYNDLNGQILEVVLFNSTQGIDRLGPNGEFSVLLAPNADEHHIFAQDQNRRTTSRRFRKQNLDTTSFFAITDKGFDKLENEAIARLTTALEDGSIWEALGNIRVGDQTCNDPAGIWNSRAYINIRSIDWEGLELDISTDPGSLQQPNGEAIRLNANVTASKLTALVKVLDEDRDYDCHLKSIMNNVNFRIEVTIQPDQDNSIQAFRSFSDISIGNSTTSIERCAASAILCHIEDVGFDWLVDAILNEDFFEEKIGEAVEDNVTDLLADVLAGIPYTVNNINILDGSYNLGFGLDRIYASDSSDGISLGLDATMASVDRVGLPDHPDHLGQDYKPQATPDLLSLPPGGKAKHDVKVALSVNTLNSALYAGYKQGILDISAVIKENFPLTVGNADFSGTLRARLEPTSAPWLHTLRGKEHQARVHADHLRVLIELLPYANQHTNTWVKLAEASVSVESPIAIGVKRNNKLSIGIDELPSIEVNDLWMIAYENFTRVAVDAVLRDVMPHLLPRLTSTLTEIAIPELDGYGGVQVTNVWADNNFVYAGGSLRIDLD